MSKITIQSDCDSQIESFNNLMRYVEERTIKLNNFLSSYDTDISMDKKHQVIGSINELNILKEILENIDLDST